MSMAEFYMLGIFGLLAIAFSTWSVEEYQDPSMDIILFICGFFSVFVFVHEVLSPEYAPALLILAFGWGLYKSTFHWSKL